MDLIDLYKIRSVEGLCPIEWYAILEENLENDSTNNFGNAHLDTEIHIKNSGPGVIILSNNKIVKCVIDYYKYRDESKNNKKSSTLSNQCYEVKRHFDLPVTGTKDCVSCHKMCLDLRNNMVLRHSNIWV